MAGRPQSYWQGCSQSMTDFVVIGGGIAGVSAAAHLASYGSVILYEQESSLAYHTTGRSAAMLVENYGSAGARPLVKGARPFLETPPEYSVDGPLLSPRPVMWVSPQGSLDSLQAIADKGRTYGANPVVLGPGEVIEKMPLMDERWVAGGLIEYSGADIDVAALHQAFVRMARRHGATILNDSPVTSIKKTGTTWTVNTPKGSTSSDVVVNASGAWGDRVAELADVERIGLQPMRRTAFMVPGAVDYTDLPMVVDVGENWYLRPDGVQLLCSLAEETPSEPMDAKPQMEDVALAIDRINEATNLRIRTVNSQWAGLRTFSPDRDLVIGEDPTAPGFFWLVGQGGIGIQTSPAYGSLLASLVTESDLDPALAAAGVEADRTKPDRFRR